MQRDATLLANNTTLLGPTFCVRLHGTTTMLALVAYSLKPVKLFVPCKRTQHCWPKNPNNTQQCCDLLRPFAWAFVMTTHFREPRYTQCGISNTAAHPFNPPTLRHISRFSLKRVRNGSANYVKNYKFKTVQKSGTNYSLFLLHPKLTIVLYYLRVSPKFNSFVKTI